MCTLPIHDRTVRFMASMVWEEEVKGLDSETYEKCSQIEVVNTHFILISLSDLIFRMMVRLGSGTDDGFTDQRQLGFTVLCGAQKHSEVPGPSSEKSQVYVLLGSCSSGPGSVLKSGFRVWSPEKDSACIF